MSSAIAGLRAHQTAMDVVGNNIANVNTYGFKASTTMFRDVMYQTLAAGSGGQAGVSGGTNPSQVGYGANASAVEVNMGRAGMAATNNDTDCYIDGEGYYVVANGMAKDTDGNSVPTGYVYTRVGDNLRFDSNGYLVDGAGNYICGVNNGDGATADLTKTGDDVKLDMTGTDTSPFKPVPICYPLTQKDADDNDVPVTLGSISIGKDGTITAEKDGSSVVVGRIAVASFTNPAGLTAVGNSYYSAESGNTGTPVYGKPGDNSTGTLVTGALEASGTDLATEFSNMIQFERGFQANTKIVTVNDEMLQTLVNMKN
jgi:flagellar hook protein FlgE